MANARPGGWNDSIIAQFRANGGQMTSGPFTGRTLLLLTTKGAKTSVERTSPLVYSRDGERFVIVASVATAAERRRLYDKHAERMPAFWDYEKKTTRKIPVVVLERI